MCLVLFGNTMVFAAMHPNTNDRRIGLMCVHTSFLLPATILPNHIRQYVMPDHVPALSFLTKTRTYPDVFFIIRTRCYMIIGPSANIMCNAVVGFSNGMS